MNLFDWVISAAAELRATRQQIIVLERAKRLAAAEPRDKEHPLKGRPKPPRMLRMR